MVLLAFSLQDQVQKYGSYVGIAAFFGLAILSLLYFAQAREVKRLREWAGRAPERAREVEEAALAAADAARRRPPPVAVPQAAPQPVAAATAAGGRSGTVSPAVPVGAAGTAVAEQERPEGESSEDDDGEAPAVEGPVTADGRRPVAAKAPEVKADEDADEAERDDDDPRDEAEDADTDGDEAADAEQPAPAAGSPTNGAPPAGAEPPVFPRPSTAAGVASAAGAGAATPAGAAAAPAPNRPAPAMPLRAGAPSASPGRSVTQPPRRTPPPAATSSRHGGRRWAIAGGVLAVIAALGVFAATQLLNDNTPTKPNQAATPTASATRSATASGGQSPTSRADTTVAVFNGTTVNGLASQTADKLAGSGYKRGSTGDYTDQQRATSTIFYRRNARRQARDIGRELNISDLRAMDAETQALAGGGAAVAVVVGSDKAP
ncbi:MAG: hypothetical protein QOC68_3426 [Solirubrobacteraceae bacterium]|jgi:hypothetical protein|nr:hypothetical protein [Solirubrobacteraceae bacterium]